MEYRRELKVLFDNITQLVSHLQTVRSIRVSSTTMLCCGVVTLLYVIGPV